MVQREDDTEEAIGRRLELYERQTAPLIEWYQHHELLVAVNGTGSPDAVTRRCVKAVDEHRNGRRAHGPTGGGTR